MAVLTLEEAIVECRAEGMGDDARIDSLLKAAIGSASGYINRSIPWKDADGTEVEVPEDVNAAIRLELRALYDNPDDVQGPAFKALLAQYRVY